jgi:hypothetical protein
LSNNSDEFKLQGVVLEDWLNKVLKIEENDKSMVPKKI